MQVTNNGLEALAAHQAGTYDLILMDIQMPEMGGIEATHAIRERETSTGQHTRIVAMTAHAMMAIASGTWPRAWTAIFQSRSIRRRCLRWLKASPRRSRAALSPKRRWLRRFSFDDMRRRLNDDDDLVEQVIEIFLADCPHRLAEIRAAVSAGNPVAIRAGAHALTGAASNMSAGPVAECSLALEQLVLKDAVDGSLVAAALARLEAEASRLLTALRSGPPLRRVAHTS